MTEYVFRLPSRAFLRGAGSAFDLFGRSVRGNAPSAAAADRLAIESDWSSIGSDLRAAIDTTGEPKLAAR